MRSITEARIIAILLKRRFPMSVTQIEQDLVRFDIIFKDFSSLCKGLRSMWLRGLLEKAPPVYLGAQPGRPTCYQPTEKGKALVLDYALEPALLPTTTSTTTESLVQIKAEK